MKKHVWITILIVMTLIIGSIWTVQAEIIPPYGEGQIGLSAVVLCENLTVRQAPVADTGIITSLQGGARIIVMEQTDGWAEISTSDSEDDAIIGWVKSDYLAIDPAWYRTDKATPVYAWNDTAAPKVGLLDKDTVLPILKDDGGWIVVGLRGASGWIQK